MERAQSQIILSALLKLYERTDVLNDIGRVADLIYFFGRDAQETLGLMEYWKNGIMVYDL